MYFDWFRQTTLVPYPPLSGTLKVGAINNLDPSGQQDNDINVAAPSTESFIRRSPPRRPRSPLTPSRTRVSSRCRWGPASSITSRPAPPWTFTGDTYNGLASQPTTAASPAANPSAQEGSQVAFLQRSGSFSRSAAGSDQLTFGAAQRASNPSQPSREDLEVLLDGNSVGTFQPSSTSYQSYTTAPFTVTAGTHTITFQGLDSVGGDNTAFLDEVVASPVAASGGSGRKRMVQDRQATLLQQWTDGWGRMPQGRAAIALPWCHFVPPRPPDQGSWMTSVPSPIERRRQRGSHPSEASKQRRR